MKSQISVIMSVYNESLEDLTLSIQSIINQTYQNFEFIIIIDNPENDIAIKYIQDLSILDSRIRYYINEKNMGLVQSLNKALSLATAPYVARMDADDISEPSRLEVQLNYMLKNQNIDLISSNANIIDEYGNFKYRTKHHATCVEHAKQILCYNNNFMHATWFLKRSVYEALGGYREVRYCEDYDFLCRLVLNGYNPMILPDYLLSYRLRSTGISQSNALSQRKSMLSINSQYRKLLKSSIKKEIKIHEVKITEGESNRYIKAKEYWDRAVYNKKIKNYFSATINLIRGFILSKYIRIGFMNNLNLKLLNVRYR